jgi:hypothetical protein
VALARVVTFEGVDASHLGELRSRIESEGGPPEEIPATELIVLHDPETSTSTTIVFFDSEEDYARGNAALDAMPAEETPGRRTSVRRFDVAIRMSASPSA